MEALGSQHDVFYIFTEALSNIAVSKASLSTNNYNEDTFIPEDKILDVIKEKGIDQINKQMPVITSTLTKQLYFTSSIRRTMREHASKTNTTERKIDTNNSTISACCECVNFQFDYYKYYMERYLDNFNDCNTINFIKRMVNLYENATNFNQLKKEFATAMSEYLKDKKSIKCVKCDELFYTHLL